MDEVRWIPAAQSPLKKHSPVAPDEARLQMLRLAISGADGHVVDDREIRRGDISYTVDTVSDLRAEMSDCELLMIIGSDSLTTIRQWHEPQKLLSQVIPAVVQRGGEEEFDFSVLEGLVDAERIDQCRKHVIRMPVIEISSTELRRRIAEGQSIRFRTPRSVEAMIQSQKLYQRL